MATFKSLSIVSFENYNNASSRSLFDSDIIKKARLELMSFVVHLSDFAEILASFRFERLHRRRSSVKLGGKATSRRGVVPNFYDLFSHK